MSQRKAFFNSLPGKIQSLPHGEQRLVVAALIELPSGATCKKLFELRLGRLMEQGQHHWQLIAKDGVSYLESYAGARWRALKSLIDQQGGLEKLISERSSEIGALFKETRSWELSLYL